MRIAAEIVDRAREQFPGGPIRTPDTIHLASLHVARSAVAGLQLLSLDDVCVKPRMGWVSPSSLSEQRYYEAPVINYPCNFVGFPAGGLQASVTNGP